MANNRYYLHCPCGENKYLGKSLGDNIYGPGSFMKTDEQNWGECAAFLHSIYDWMWAHLMANHAGLHKEDDVLSPEWVEGEIFKVLTEYDERVK